MNKSKGGKKDKGEGKGKPGEITPGDEKTDSSVTPGSMGEDPERKEESQDVSLIKGSDQGKETPDVKSEPVGEGKRTTGGLGKNPLDRIDPSGLQGLIGRSKTDINIEQDLLYTKAVKLTYEDLEFIKDMAISVKEEGNISAGIRACIKVARKQVGDKIKELAAARKASEAFEI
jgi:hypothetical protein